MSPEDYGALAAALNGASGKVALSAYEHPIVDGLFPGPKWTKVKFAPRRNYNGTYKTEALYANYDLYAVLNGKSLF
jgi:hypothetical protein